MDKKTQAEKIIDALGGTSATARLCNIAAPSVSEWKINGIPDARMLYFKVLRPDIFKRLKEMEK